MLQNDYTSNKLDFYGELSFDSIKKSGSLTQVAISFDLFQFHFIVLLLRLALLGILIVCHFFSFQARQAQYILGANNKSVICVVLFFAQPCAMFLFIFYCFKKVNGA